MENYFEYFTYPSYSYLVTTYGEWRCRNACYYHGYGITSIRLKKKFEKFISILEALEIS